MLMMGQNIDHLLLITFTLLAFFSAVTGLVVPQCVVHDAMECYSRIQENSEILGF